LPLYRWHYYKGHEAWNCTFLPSLSPMMLDHAAAITQLQDLSNDRWHARLPLDMPANAFLATVLEQHRANYDLWHAEDAARSPMATDHEVAQAKRLIDTTNQQRNDLTEQLDEMLLASLPSPSVEAELHSETPGLMIDRLSILSLKLYHTREEIERSDAPEGHRERNLARLAVLTTQRDDLGQCLDRLWAAVLRGDRRFKVYRQLKMYNDPALNPAVYNAG
jgi:hypothetical protein